jgi:chromate reductase, NAD(P)H dehydrogenase (quinone)
LTIKILGICGSLRADSYNKACLFAAREVAPPGVEVDIYIPAGFPAFNEDIEKQPPPAVMDLKEKIKSANGIMIATPEYNHGLPGGLKNAIDWASRPKGDNSWDGKPLAIMSASTGLLGGVRAQLAFRQMAVFLNVKILNKPEVFIPFANKKIEYGKLVDEETRGYIKKLVEALVNTVMHRLSEEE